MKTTNNEKTCLNCENFRQHYTLGVRDMFITNYGHCKSYQTRYKLINTLEENGGCEFWKPVRNYISDSERIVAALEAVKRKLYTIELLLKDK